MAPPSDHDVSDRDVAAFLDANPDVDLAALDFLDRPALARLRLPQGRAAAVLGKLRAWQRVRRVAGDSAAAGALIARGFDSAHRIAVFPEHRFVREHADLFGGDAFAAGAAHRRAVAVKAAVTHLYANLHGTVAAAHFSGMRGASIGADLIDYVTSVPSYQDLFGGLDYLTCPHCSSIFGPAAYFTDLMRIIDDYITDANPDIPAGYSLAQRRPDLFELPLTCANTNDLVPMLDIVNAILARQVAAHPVGSAAEPPPDPYATLAAAPYPFNLPWNLPLAEIRRNLDVLGTSLPEVYEALAAPVTGGTARAGTATQITLADSAAGTDGAYLAMQVAVIGGTGAGQVRTVTAYTGATRVAEVDRPWQQVPDGTTQYHVVDPGPADRERVGLSVEREHLVTTPVTDATALARYYGVDTIDVTELSRVETFCARTGLHRDQLIDLFVQGLSAAEQVGQVGASFFINATGEGLPPLAVSAENTIEHLTIARLDRLNRFIRLAASLGWEPGSGFAALDWAMRSVGATEIDRWTIHALSGVQALRERTGLGVVELCALWADLKTIGRGDGPAPADLFDRVFNQPAVLAGQNPYTSKTPIPFDPARPITWDPSGTASADAVIRGRLLTALGVGDDDLTRLATFLWGEPDRGSSVRLTLAALSQLYRLATAARAFRLTVEEYLTLLDLLSPADPAGASMPTVDGVLAQWDRVEWLRSSGVTVYTLLYVLRGTRTPYFRPPYTDDAVAPFIAGVATAAEDARLRPGSFDFDAITAEAAAQAFHALVTTGQLTSLGILRDDATRYLVAAGRFPLDRSSFVTSDISPEQSADIFVELCESQPPVLLPPPGSTLDPAPPEVALLSRSFTDQTDLGFLLTGQPEAANKRNQVRGVLLGTMHRIEVTEFAALFPIDAGGFASRQIASAASAHVFDQLAAHDPPLVVPDPAAGQQRLIADYDGATRTATLDSPWTVVPTPASSYLVTRVEIEGTARGGGLFSVTLAEDAAPDDGAYTGMAVRITSGNGAGQEGVITDYDGESRTATLSAPWVVLPAEGSGYEVRSPSSAGRVRTATATTIQLEPDASPVDQAYTAMPVSIPATGALDAAYTPQTELEFLFRSKGSGQTRTITGYDGDSRTATVDSPWEVEPDLTTYYTVTRTVDGASETVAAGLARGGGPSALYLDPDASAVTGEYDELTLSLVADPAADLKRGEVGRDLLTTLSAVRHAADVIAEAAALQREYAVAGLADLLGTTTQRLAGLVPAVTRVADVADYLDELLTPIRDGQVPPAVPRFIAVLSRGLVLFDALETTNEQVAAVADLPRAVNLDPVAVAMDDVVALTVFMGLAREFADHPGELVEYFRRPDDPVLPGPKLTELSRLTGWPAAQIVTLIERWWPAGLGTSQYGYATAAGVARLSRCFDLAGHTGLDVSSMLRLVALAYLPATTDAGAEDNWQVYRDTAQLALDAVGARYREPEFSAVNDETVGILNEAKRDALLGYTAWVLNRTYPAITDPDSLYQFLLIDVEMSGCAVTSYIAQGIGAVQLYMQRCRLMLEPGVTDLSHIPQVWWEWMSNYRIWEANRKIFLYPENYLQPALRRGASPSFAALTDTLMETEVTDRSTEDAYRGYIDDFAVVGNLVLVDAYQTRLPKEGTSVVRDQGQVVAATDSTVELPSTASDLYNAYADLRISITAGTGAGQSRTITNYNSATRIATVTPQWNPVPGSDSRYVITGPKLLDTLFLVGRTNADPYTYYHRRSDVESGWSPWREVAATIPARLVTPVYAFDRLFLYWVEQSTSGSSTIRSTNDRPESRAITSVSAAVRFCYLRPDGTWSAVQTAAPDLMIDYQQDYTLDEYVSLVLPGLAPTFDPQREYWQKVFPLHVPAKKVTRPDRYPNGELVLLTYGLSLRFQQGQPLPPPDPPPSAIPRQQHAFESEAYRLSTSYSQMAQAPIQTATGYLPFAPWLGISSTLERTKVAAALINYLPLSVPQPYLPVINRTDGTVGMQLSSSWNLVIDDYWSDDYPDARNPAEPPAIDAPLLRNASAASGAVITVKNLPGSFVFGNGDESFLVRSSDPGIRTISETTVAVADKPPFPAGFLYLQSSAFTDTAVPFDELTFAFTRLSTRAAEALSQRLLAGGVPQLLSLAAQRTPELPFDRLAPTDKAVPPASDTLDFAGAYGPYFWEIFFHAPLLVAETLTTARRFRDARTWLEYIYNPTQLPGPGDEGTQRYWRFLPFRSMDLPTLTQTLANPAQIAAYNDRPFDPDAIARLRISAYAKAVVIRYVGNLLDWGDDLFTQDTRESIDQATNLYVLARDLLGPRPAAVGTCAPAQPETYRTIKESYQDRTLVTGTLVSAGADTAVLDTGASPVTDAYTGAYLAVTSGPGAGQVRYLTAYDGATRTATTEDPWDARPEQGDEYRVFVNGVPQFLIRMENSAPIIAATSAEVDYRDVPFNDIGTYFCVPENDQLSSLWDRAEDRLYKIRHCMNIEGRVRPLPLFAPPINPAALVRGGRSATAAPGVTSQPNPPVPQYRFEVMVQRAKELAGTVAGLGGELLATLEKKDAAALALLRVSQEQALLNQITSIKELAVEQAEQAGEALTAALASAEQRLDYYTELITTGLSPSELDSIAKMQRSTVFNLLATAVRSAASLGYAIPQAGSPFAMTYGGQQIGSMLYAASGVFDAGALLASYESQLSLTMAQYERRESEWRLQADLAGHDIAQIDAQIAANDTQLTIARRDLAVHLAQIDQTADMEAFLTSQFTNEQLYQWLASRLSALHFQTYSLALELARAAQRAYQYELDQDKTFVNFGYWDGGRRGLLAGEGLLLALNQMEQAYLDQHSRPLQMEKTISLAQLDPLALATLLRTGECVFAFPEKIFDDDYPGHYARKICSLAVSIPAITGPYQNLHATLTQLGNQVIVAPDVNAVDFLLGGAQATQPGPDVLRSDWRVSQQIALSTGMSDNGVHDTSAMDGRYLPFEGTGAISTWRLRLPRQTNHFDFDAITDVIIALRYQARDGGDRFRDQVVRLPAMSGFDGSVSLPLAQVFSAQWYEFLHQPTSQERQTLRFQLADLVPAHVSGAVLTGFAIHLQTPAGTATAGRRPYLQLRLGTGVDTVFNLNTDGDHQHKLAARPRISTVEGPATLTAILADTPTDLLTPPPPPRYLNPEVIQNAMLVLLYQGRVDWSRNRR